MKCILVSHRGQDFITDCSAEDVAKVIHEAEDYARAHNGNWELAVKHIQRRYYFDEAKKVRVF